MRAFYRFAAVTVSLAAFVSDPAAAESFRPLRTQSTQTLRARQLEVDLAVEYRNNATFPFTKASDQPDREELEIPRFGLNVGLAERVELQLDYAYLDIKEEAPGIGSESGSGDARFFTKWRFLDQENWRPDLALHIGAKLPNAEDDKRLGTDETDLFFNLLIGRHDERFETAINVGLGILGAPESVGSDQDDVLTYGIAVVYKVIKNLDVAGEINGVAASNHENDKSAILMALRYQFRQVRFYLGGSAGITSRAEDFGIIGGATWHYAF
jgi:hypothetical protein